MMTVVCISGKAESGKDTVADIIQDILTDSGRTVLITHYADLVKYVCMKFFDWDGEKNEYGRGILQYVGTDVIRTADPDYWVNFVGQMLNFFDGEWDYVLIPDCRFPNECEIMKEKFHTLTLRVERPGHINRLTEDQRSHPSETSMDDYTFDATIINDGTVPGIITAVSNWVKENLEL